MLEDAYIQIRELEKEDKVPKKPTSTALQKDWTKQGYADAGSMQESSKVWQVLLVVVDTVGKTRTCGKQAIWKSGNLYWIHHSLFFIWWSSKMGGSSWLTVTVILILILLIDVANLNFVFVKNSKMENRHKFGYQLKGEALGCHARDTMCKSSWERKVDRSCISMHDSFVCRFDCNIIGSVAFIVQGKGSIIKIDLMVQPVSATTILDAIWMIYFDCAYLNGLYRRVHEFNI